MKLIEILITCQNEPNHAKKLRMDEDMGIDRAMDFAELLTGKSRFYVYKPGALSPIGKCATCGGKLDSKVYEIEMLKKDVKRAEASG